MIDEAKLAELAGHLGTLPYDVDEWTSNDKHIAANFIDACVSDCLIDEVRRLRKENDTLRASNNALSNRMTIRDYESEDPTL